MADPIKNGALRTEAEKGSGGSQYDGALRTEAEKEAAAADQTATGAPSVFLPTSSGAAAIVPVHPATGAPSVFLPTSSGTAELEHTATGAPSALLPTATGAAFIWPKVYLNTTEVLGGATEMTVTDANAAGTSITFDDPSGEPTGSIFLGVENRNNSEVGWIAVTVGLGINSATGAPAAILPTSSGAAVVEKKATGAALVALVLAAGAATVINTADGAPSTFLPTSSGTAELIHTADGSPSIFLPTSAGVAVIENTADGAPTIFLPTAAGVASMERSASGAPSTTLITASGVGEGIQKGDGAPSVFLPTSSGAAGLERSATGSPAAFLPTAAGSAFVGSAGNGAPLVFLPTSAGAAFIEHPATGAVDVFLPTSAGAAKFEWASTGAVSAFLPTASGTAEVLNLASGAPSVFLPSARGAEVTNLHTYTQQYDHVSNPWGSAGATVDMTAGIAPDGTLTANDVRLNASGNWLFQSKTVVAGETYTYSQHFHQGDVGDHQWVMMRTQTSGFQAWFDVKNIAVGSSNAYNGGSIVDLGIIDEGDGWRRIWITGTLTPASTEWISRIQNVTADGGFTSETTDTLWWWGSQLELGDLHYYVHSPAGSPVTGYPYAGVAEVIKTATGSPSTILITASGVSEGIQKADGAPIVFLPAATGLAVVEKFATGTPSVFLPTSSGAAVVERAASGAPSTTLITSAGEADEDAGAHESDGATSVFLPTASGASFLWPKVYINTTQTLIGATELIVTAATADGTSITFTDPVGAPVGSVWLAVENRDTGQVGWRAVTIIVGQTADGAPSVFLPTSSGTAEVINPATGYQPGYWRSVHTATNVSWCCQT